MINQLTKKTQMHNETEFRQDMVNVDTDRLLSDKPAAGILSIKTVGKVIEAASSQAVPKDYYHKLIHENETIILFADTGQGKSILAYQIADKVSRDGIPTLYADFELSGKQIENRYSDNYTNHYIFHDNFYRAEISMDQADLTAVQGKSIDELIIDGLIDGVKQLGAKFLVVDNITYLGKETEKSRDALPLMQKLKRMQKELGITILCLAHTPKRDESRPITKNDLAGSKMLINFCDSAFAIGKSSQDNSMRYIKQLKARATEEIYHADNVAVYRITKPSNFLHFQFLGFSTEWEHLKQITDADIKQRENQVMELHKAGRSLREIQTELGFNDHMQVNRIIKKHESRA